MSRRWRTMIVVVALVVAPLVAVGSFGAWVWWQLTPPGGEGAKVEIDIPLHWSVSQIGDELSHRGVIGPSWLFSVYARLNNDTKFQAGTYAFRKHMGIEKAIKTLKKGPIFSYSTLTIPPGLWLTDIAARVGRLPGRSADDFIAYAHNNAVRSAFEPDGVNTLEGLLWPDTYKIAASDTEIGILKSMAQNFDKKAAALGLSNANVQGQGPYQVLIVASLIEAEAKVDADRPLIASVIYNRLARNMPLQVDATLIYARGDAHNRVLTDADKAINSPYNTYAHTGLPPTPIAAVSAASLEAALHPAQTTYLYYVVIDKQGHHAFASTLQQHEHNIQIAKQNGVL